MLISARWIFLFTKVIWLHSRFHCTIFRVPFCIVCALSRKLIPVYRFWSWKIHAATVSKNFAQCIMCIVKFPQIITLISGPYTILYRSSPGRSTRTSKAGRI